jgi:hypothetical protein
VLVKVPGIGGQAVVQRKRRLPAHGAVRTAHSQPGLAHRQFLPVQSDAEPVDKLAVFCHELTFFFQLLRRLRLEGVAESPGRLKGQAAIWCSARPGSANWPARRDFCKWCRYRPRTCEKIEFLVRFHPRRSAAQAADFGKRFGQAVLARHLLHVTNGGQGAGRAHGQPKMQPCAAQLVFHLVQVRTLVCQLG